MRRAAAWLVASLLLVTLPAPAAALPAVRYELPVMGAVLREFSAPAHTYGVGHRGVDLAAAAGGTVRASAAGEVTFAGQVGAARWVTIAHADGVRTSYGHMETLAVAVGERVRLGQPVGTATGRNGEVLRPEPGLHWSARRGGSYLDPLTLVEGGTPRPTLVGPGGWRGSDPVVDAYAPYPGGHRFGVLAPPSPRAERRGYARPPNHHHLVQLQGYGTAGPAPLLRPSFLGYGEDDASVVSYRGCRVTSDGCEPRRYDGRDTDLTIEEAMDRLEEHLRAQQRAQPGRPVDLLGHSMGGDVATTYLTERYDPWDPGLPPIANLITVGTPHGGSGLAYLARAVGNDPLLGHGAELVRRAVVAAGAEGADRVGFGSAPIDRYGGIFGSGRPERDPDRLAELGIDVLAIAGSRDLVVGRSDAAAARGEQPVVLPGGHSSVLAPEATYDAVHDHLAGREVVGAGGAAGWASDEVATLGRWAGAWVDLSPLMSFSKALAAEDVARALWETGKAAIGGPDRR